MTIGTTTRLSLTTWSVDEDAVSRVQFTNSHQNLEDLAAKFTTGATTPTATSAYARAFFYNTTSATLHFCPDGATWLQVGYGTDFVRLTGAQTLTGKTLTSPVISTISNTGTLTLPTSTDTLVGRATTDTLTNKTLTSPTINYGILKTPEEVWTVTAAAPSATQAIYIEDSGARLFTSNATTNFTLNITGNSGGTTLNSLLSNNTSVTVAIGVTNGATAYYPTAFQVDGTAVTPKWQGGNSPTSGNASAIDVYTFSIVKTASATYTILASQTKFS